MTKTDNKIPPPCQEKNIALSGRRDPSKDYFFFVAFFVAFFALGCFIPQAIIFSPPSFFSILIYLSLLI